MEDRAKPQTYLTTAHQPQSFVPRNTNRALPYKQMDVLQHHPADIVLFVRTGVQCIQPVRWKSVITSISNLPYDRGDLWTSVKELLNHRLGIDRSTKGDTSLKA
jgi:hypothetical protein